MDLKGLLKIAVLVLVALAMAPVLLTLLPEPLAMADVPQAFTKAGFDVVAFNPVVPPQLEAAEHYRLRWQLPDPPGNTAALTGGIYRFTNEGTIRKQYEYNKPGTGEGIAQAFVASAGLGTARKPKPVGVGRNGMYLLVITGESKTAVKRAVAVFERL